MDVSVTATGVDVRVQIDEDGSVVCAALSDVTGACTADIELLSTSSGGLWGCKVTRSNVLDERSRCITRSSMWVDDGCSGRFWLEGAEVDCQSSELDTTIHDAAFASVLSVGHRHACALRKEDRAAVCWGKADYIDPVTFSAPAGSFKSIAAGYVHTCAVDEATELITCWGSDLHGETAGPGGISTFDYVTSGYQFSCALRSSDHKAECWGLDDSGQASPPDVAFLTISAGYRHVCGIQLADYQILCWGLNDVGQCSPPSGEFLSQSDRGEPLPHGSLSSGWAHGCVVRKSDQGISCWGDNSNGQTDAPQDARFIQVSAGHYHTCGLHQVLAGQGPGLVKNGTVRCWGLDTFGQSSPYSATSTPSVGFGGIALDDDYSCGLCFDGVAYCWGKDDFGQASPPTDSFSIFGLPDEFENVTCQSDSAASSQRIKGISGARDASASASLVYESTVGYAEAFLTLTGLSEGSTYGIYCTVEDDEVPVLNVLSNSVIAAVGREVTMPDRTAPQWVAVRSVAPAHRGAVWLTVASDEPVKAYCVARRDGEAPPTRSEILKSSSLGYGVLNLTNSILLENLALDTSYDAYCTVRDLAGNWAADQVLAESKFDFHVARDLVPPQLLSTEPSSGSTVVCEADGFEAGCKTTLKLIFDEDLHRGVGNLTAVCLNNPGICLDLDLPMETETSTHGSSSILFNELTVHFTTPLTDASNFKVVIDSGALRDMSGNPVSLDETCVDWIPATAKDALPDACLGTFAFWTPS
ncbi:unnamed protein product [Durusdinium trenchii]|uniref:non-specific serine/threonine protein kinase n=1 Tax=Durusdinium trenchii TaxID=1381693 RepID=A0ABP0J4D0_9DINO